MAPKRSTPLEEPPPASLSEEQEISSGEEEEDEEGEEAKSSSSEEEEEETGGAHKPSSTPLPQTKEPNSAGSDPESGSDSEPDNAASVKTIASKPMEQATTVSKKPRSKSVSGSKRASESSWDPKESKRANQKGTDGAPVEKSSEDIKKLLFQRLWSEDDEITVLNGMIEFAAKRGVSPTSDMEVFHELIKKSLQIDATRSQLVEKIRRLKKKFENNEGKSKKGEGRTFSKPHDQKAFDLSKKIWGKEGTNAVGAESGLKSNGKSGKKGQRANKRLLELKREVLSSPNAVKEEKKADGEKRCSGGGWGELVRIDKSVSGGGLEGFVLDKGLELVEGAKRVEIEKKWRSYHVAELELFVRRVELIREQAKLVLDTYKSAEN